MFRPLFSKRETLCAVRDDAGRSRAKFGIPFRVIAVCAEEPKQ